MEQITAHFPVLPHLLRAFNFVSRSHQKTVSRCPECGRRTRLHSHQGKRYEVCKEAFCPDPLCFWFREQMPPEKEDVL